MKRYPFFFSCLILLFLTTQNVQAIEVELSPTSNQNWLNTRRILSKVDNSLFNDYEFYAIKNILVTEDGINVKKLTDTALLLTLDDSLLNEIYDIDDIVALIQTIDPMIMARPDYPIQYEAIELPPASNASSNNPIIMTASSNDPLYIKMKPYVYDPINMDQAFTYTTGSSRTMITLLDFGPLPNENFLVQSGEYQKLLVDRRLGGPVEAVPTL